MLLVETLKQQLTLEDILFSLKDKPFLFCLDSSLPDPKRGRYSFVGCEPFDTYRAKGFASLEELRGRFNRYAHAHYDTCTPFASGIVGFLSYDYGLNQEEIIASGLDDAQLPDCLFAFYDRVLTVDHLEGKIYVTSTGLGHPAYMSRPAYAEKRLNDLIGLLRPSSFRETEKIPAGTPLSLSSNFTKEKYLRAIEQALAYISTGEIYQINLSQRFSYSHEEPMDSVGLYDHLRKNFPTHFSAFFNAGKYQILSSSPERFLNRRKRRVETQPMKGTRARSADMEEDARLRFELETNEKEKAELLMVTDLERNDLGRVCRYGTVHVEQLRVIEAYRNIYQAISTVTGELREDKDSFDLLQAAFPGGSITGCPKIRAIEIIDELEPTRRSLYTGILGYMNFNGDMDFNILIRTLLVCGKKVSFQVGGGIVADSDPEKEYAETLLKAEAMISAIRQTLTEGQPTHL